MSCFYDPKREFESVTSAGRLQTPNLQGMGRVRDLREAA